MIVTDLGSGVRPKLVYNCAYLGALCLNARRYIGTATTTATFHYDKGHVKRNMLVDGNGQPKFKKDGKTQDYEDVNFRGDQRRDESCPKGWAIRRPGGVPRCPEANQPDFWAENPPVRRAVKMFEVLSTTGTPPLQVQSWTKHPNHMGNDLGLKDAQGNPAPNTWQRNGYLLSW